ncbi:uncharacterized protein OCT59_019532 [Rhizophagus irregularis]|uniref:uncharacterized protein n=1 Tax=Rhizophagus irregularis TaxID=588596 RepID=UPI0033247FEA|nr:hypothetical protein OCT59_019532 [Rhizophagus irregularis]
MNGIYSICDIEIDNKVLNNEEIKYNINDLKKKLKTNNSSYALEIRLDLEYIDIDKLTNDSDIIKNLSVGVYQSFIKLAKQIKINSLPNIIQEECNQFLNDFKKENLNLLYNKYKHNNTWIESNEKLCEITKEILNTLSNIWKNPAFKSEFANIQSKGTYVTDVIVPLLRTTLKDLIIGNVNLLSTAEKQKKKDKLVELIFVEYFCLICSNDKEEKDKIKLWREMNDGINYIYKKNRFDKDEFGILGIQNAGNKMHFNIIIRNTSKVNCLYHLYSTKIPVQPTSDKMHLLEFINVLLYIRNILTINISLLLNVLPIKSKRLRK